MEMEFSLSDQYLVEKNEPLPVVATKEYSYEPHEVSVEEAKQWREMFKALCTSDKPSLLSISGTRAVKALIRTNLIMFCGVKPSEIFKIKRTCVDAFLKYKDFYSLDIGDYVYLIDIMLNRPIEELAKMLSTMKGGHKIAPCNGNAQLNRITFCFECKGEIGDKNENENI